MAQTPSIPLAHDWRDKESYAYTEGLPTQAWAWEFLRRNPKYHAHVAAFDRSRIRVRQLGPTLKAVTLLELSSQAESWGLIFP